MKSLVSIFLFFIVSYVAISQENIRPSKAIVDDILKGNYDPTEYQSSNTFEKPQDILPLIEEDISAQQILTYLEGLVSFETRHTASDTVSTTRGIGAARNWAFEEFKKISEDNENRLIPAFLDFEELICDVDKHRNVIAVLPGMESDPSFILIEAHMDSRCEDRCDSDCEANGADDNGSGSSLVLELARVLSKYSYKHTIVFMLTIGEEQGLLGANAFAQYCDDNQLSIKAVLNNDIVGGIICGKTASPPGCPTPGHIDSTTLKIFSSGVGLSLNKQLARFSKMQYQQEILPTADVAMELRVMSQADRGGRGGDHIPFHERGYTALRYTSANEHGNADTSNPDYCDRQHSTRDRIGDDIDGDGVFDEFFLDFNYLARNTFINGLTAIMASEGPETPTGFNAYERDDGLIQVDIFDDAHDMYWVLVRTENNDFDTLIFTEERSISYVGDPFAFVSIAAIDECGVESLFTNEIFIPLSTSIDEETQESIQFLESAPNPFTDELVISFVINGETFFSYAFLEVYDLQGRLVDTQRLNVTTELNKIRYVPDYEERGTFVFKLNIGGEIFDAIKVVRI
jgi:hypothetical protein